jgi:hypothetical protein
MMRQQPALMTLRIIWFALLASCFVYMAIAYVVLADVKKAGSGLLNPMTPTIFAVVSVALAVASFLVPRIVYQQTTRVMNSKTEEEVASSAFPDRYREAMPKRVVFAEPETAAKTAFLCFHTPFILALAFSEAVALLGFLAAQMGYPLPSSLPFFVAGALLIAIRFPRQSTVLGMFERARGASFPK